MLELPEDEVELEVELLEELLELELEELLEVELEAMLAADCPTEPVLLLMVVRSITGS